MEVAVLARSSPAAAPMTVVFLVAAASAASLAVMSVVGWASAAAVVGWKGMVLVVVTVSSSHLAMFLIKKTTG